MKTALITGANRGLGLETSKQLLKLGFYVYMGVRNTECIASLTQELSKDFKNFSIVPLDILKNDQIRSILSELRAKEIKLDLLINNAGVFLESDGPRIKESASVFEADPVIVLKTIETNTIGALKMIQFCVPYMQQNGGGRIINISSGMGQISSMEGYWPGYRMSKASMNVLTKMVDDEAGKDNIIINSVSPGWVKTDMGGKDARLSLEEGVDSIIWLATVKKSPQGKFIGNRKEIPW